MKEKNSRKKVIIVSAICLIIALAAAVAAIVALCNRNYQDVVIGFTQEITVTNEKAEPEMTAWELPISQEGRYSFHVEWQVKQPAFVTGCVVKDEQGEVVFAVTGDSVIADSVEKRLTKQTYSVEIHYLASEQDYIRFVTDYITHDMDKIAEFELEESGNGGSWIVDYVIEAKRVTNAAAAFVFVGVIIGILCVVLLLALTKTDKGVKCRFDERQELVRGRGFKYGFFTLLICNAIGFALTMAEIPMYAEAEVIMATSCFLGIDVYAVYCIWNEGYFALNENRRTLMLAFAVIGVLNFLISAVSIAEGTMIQNGKLTFHSLNLGCGLLFVVIFVSMLLKKICKDRKDEQV